MARGERLKQIKRPAPRTSHEDAIRSVRRRAEDPQWSPEATAVRVERELRAPCLEAGRFGLSR
jgi:hypothetical protein